MEYSLPHPYRFTYLIFLSIPFFWPHLSSRGWTNKHISWSHSPEGFQFQTDILKKFIQHQKSRVQNFMVKCLASPHPSSKSHSLPHRCCPPTKKCFGTNNDPLHSMQLAAQYHCFSEWNLPQISCPSSLTEGEVAAPPTHDIRYMVGPTAILLQRRERQKESADEQLP